MILGTRKIANPEVEPLTTIVPVFAAVAVVSGYRTHAELYNPRCGPADRRRRAVAGERVERRLPAILRLMLHGDRERARMRRALALIAGLVILGPITTAAAQQRPEVHQAICRIIDEAAAANKLPPAFLTRILWQESRFRADAISAAGAAGVAQFMPKTAVERGLGDPLSVGPAIGEAGRLLAELKARFGNLGLAAAGYNAGAARIASWLHAQSTLPVETRRLVLAVTSQSADDWAVGKAPSALGDDRTCLAVMADLAHSPRNRPAEPAWLVRLARAIDQAVSVATDHPPNRDAVGLCATIRAMGAACQVFYR